MLLQYMQVYGFLINLDNYTLLIKTLDLLTNQSINKLMEIVREHYGKISIAIILSLLIAWLYYSLYHLNLTYNYTAVPDGLSTISQRNNCHTDACQKRRAPIDAQIASLQAQADGINAKLNIYTLDHANPDVPAGTPVTYTDSYTQQLNNQWLAITDKISSLQLQESKIVDK